MKHSVFALLAIGIAFGVYFFFRVGDSAPNNRPQPRHSEPTAVAAHVEVAPTQEVAAGEARVRSAGVRPQTNAPQDSPKVVASRILGAMNKKAHTAAASTIEDAHYALDKEGIRASMKAAMPAIKDCYEGWLRLDPDLGGRLLIRFVIGPDEDDDSANRVLSSTVEGEHVGTPFFEGCVRAAIEEQRYERRSGELVVNYPFNFAQR